MILKQPQPVVLIPELIWRGHVSCPRPFMRLGSWPAWPLSKACCHLTILVAADHPIMHQDQCLLVHPGAITPSSATDPDDADMML